ncbi:hypothetical protein N0V82_001921 [Gnomoniopsis sp. IMI 355080]|nr:hypothetical protein N0V82_001921 [Gnomoniopsis sp. IMI 355080]
MSGFYSNKSRGSANPNLSKDDKILCSVDKQWERMDQYSNNELKKYNDSKRMHKPYSIRCRKHSQAPRLELTCSTCHERKPHEDFSNAQRKEDADRRRCRICVDYTETIDLFQNMPVLGEEAAPDNYKFESNGLNDEAEDQLEEAPGSSGLASDSGASIAARGRARNVDLTASLLNRQNHFNPRFLREGNSNPSSAPTDTASVGADETHRLRRQPQTYTAYGPNGQTQQRTQSVYTVSDTATNITGSSAVTAVAANRGGWAKPPSRKMPVQAPDFFTHGKTDESFGPKRYDYSESGSSDEC